MDTAVIQWYVAEVAGYSEIVANPPRFLRQKKLLFRRKYASLCKTLRRKTCLILLRIGVIFIRKQ